MVAVEEGQRCERLIDESFLAVVAAGFDRRVADVGDVRAFSRHLRLLHVAREIARAVEVRRQQVGMIRVELPQHGEQRLVRPEHLPDRLYPLHVAVRLEHVRAEVFVDDPFPWIELED